MRAVEKRLRQKIKDLEAELKEVEEDREKFREDFIRNFKEAIRLLGKGCSWSSSDLIERMSKQLRNYKWWYW